MSTTKKKVNVLFLVQFALLLALEAIFCFTPLGSIPIGPLVATLAMLPVIVTGILLGPLAGSAMGAAAGLFSFLVWTFMAPNPITAFVFTPAYPPGNFWSLVICFLPRILTGTVAGLSFRLLSHLTNRFRFKNGLVYGLSGVLGSMTNTLLVMLGIYLFFGKEYAASLGMSFQLLLGAIGTTIATNGVLEAAVSALVSYGVCFPLNKIMRRIPTNNA